MYKQEMKAKYMIVFKNWNNFQNNSFDKIQEVYNEKIDNIEFTLQRNKTWWKKYVEKFTKEEKVCNFCSSDDQFSMNDDEQICSCDLMNMTEEDLINNKK